mmetsp:Transcript_16529/g.64517  ORF Transcript_16529/g.64517 Transcript_16529/m.64517 type:complete len:491 (-) Transcript_16529:421-1893(-)
MGRARRGLDLRLARPRAAVGDVVGDRVVEQHRVLRHDADGPAQAGLRHLADVLTVDADGARVDVVEAVEQPRQRALARAARAHHRHLPAGRDLEAHAVQDRPRRVVGEVHVVEHHLRSAHLQLGRAGRIGHLALAVQQAEHLFDVGQALLDLAVDHAEEVQRDVELDHEGVDHHQVAEAHAPVHHALRGPPQHQHQRAGDDQLLAGVQHRQRHLALELGAAQLLQALVVTPRLEVLVVEILDRLVVQQRVDGLAVGHGVQLVERAAELGAPLGDDDREADVDHQRRHRNAREPRVELHPQQRQHQHDLDQRRHDAVERVADQRMHRPRAALDVARHAAGLALQVEAQRQVVQVAEHLQRDAARRALGGLGEDQLAQLGEQRGRQPQAAVGQQQAQRHHQQGLGLPGFEVQRIDQMLEQQGHADIAELGAHHEGQGQADPPAVAPQVRQKAADGAPVAARGGGTVGAKRQAMRSHAPIVSGLAVPRRRCVA